MRLCGWREASLVRSGATGPPTELRTLTSPPGTIFHVLTDLLWNMFRELDAAMGVDELISSALLALVVALLASQVLIRRRRPVPPRYKPAHGTASGGNDGKTAAAECMILFNAKPAGPRGIEFKSNADTPYPVETDCARGHFLIIHKPTGNPDLMKAEKYPYSEHMHKRRRIWEFRCQFTLKRDIDGPLFVGLEMDEYPYLSWLADKSGMLIINSFQRLCRELYFSKGDDPKTTVGEIERRQIVFPLWALDQYILTEEGDTPPDLCDPEFPRKGMIKADNRRAFSKAMTELRLRPGPTYTFGFWGPSRLVDVIGWHTSGKDLCSSGVRPPCYITMYALKPAGTEARHLDSRKDFIVHCAYWSSLKPPKAHRAKELSSADDGSRCPGEEERQNKHDDNNKGRTCGLSSNWAAGCFPSVRKTAPSQVCSTANSGPIEWSPARLVTAPRRGRS